MHDWPTLILIDKPVGITSFDVIRRLRRRYNDTHDGVRAPKMGHAGTLDPLASGLMLIGVGQGTKLLTTHTKLDKVYVAEVLLGRSTTTGDREGEVVCECAMATQVPMGEGDVVEILRSKISTTLTDMQGTLTLPVSAYSAIKKDGVPMYKRARNAEARGEQVAEADLPVRNMEVYEATLEAVRWGSKSDSGEDFVIATITFHVASGTYIRSLAEELGCRLGCPASLWSLRRTHIGSFSIQNAQKIEEV